MFSDSHDQTIPGSLFLSALQGTRRRETLGTGLNQNDETIVYDKIISSFIPHGTFIVAPMHVVTRKKRIEETNGFSLFKNSRIETVTMPIS